MVVLFRAGLALMLCSALACASGGGAAGGAKSNPNIITSDEIAQANEPTAYDVVQRLRPSFLQTRMSGTGSPAASKGGRGGSSASSGVQVFVGDIKEGGTDYLKSISSAQLREIRYYSPSDAVSKWGAGNSGGAIQVTLR